MEESVVADFTGRLYAPGVDDADPVRGRVLLSQRRLVLATADSRTTIPLSTVFDVVVGTVPGDLRSFFSDSVTLAYDREEPEKPPSSRAKLTTWIDSFRSCSRRSCAT